MAEDIRRLEDELLGKIKKLENRLNSKLELVSSENKNKFEEMENKIKSTNIKFDHFVEKNEENRIKIEKIDNLLKFESKTKDILMTQDIKLTSVSKDIESMKLKYDKFLIDNLTVPGFIGDYCKYHSIREYLENNIKEMSALNKYKDKSELDIKSYKNKLESLISQFTLSLNQYSNQQIQYVNEAKEEIKNILSFEIENLNEKIQNVRIENNKVSNDFNNKIIEINTEIENVFKLKIDLNQKFKNEIQLIEKKFNDVVNNVNKFKIEYGKIKKRFIELIEFIKDVRFRKNLVDFDGIKKKEINTLVHKIEFKKKKKEEINFDKPLDLNYDVFTGEREELEENNNNILNEEIEQKNKEEEEENKNKIIINEQKIISPSEKNNNTIVKFNNNMLKEIKINNSEIKKKEITRNKEKKEDILRIKNEEEKQNFNTIDSGLTKKNIKKMILISSSTKNFKTNVIKSNENNADTKFSNIILNSPLFNKKTHKRFNSNFIENSNSNNQSHNKQAKIISLQYPGLLDNSLGTSYKRNFNENTFEEKKNSVMVNFKEKNSENNYNSRSKFPSIKSLEKKALSPSTNDIVKRIQIFND